MSIHVMSWVWENSGAKGNRLLLLLAIADHAHDDGTGAWPSIRKLAARTRLSERAVQYLLRDIENAGHIETLPRGGPEGVNAYRVVGVQNLRPGANQRLGGAKALAPKPSLEPSFRDRFRKLFRSST